VKAAKCAENSRSYGEEQEERITQNGSFYCKGSPPLRETCVNHSAIKIPILLLYWDSPAKENRQLEKLHSTLKVLRKRRLRPPHCFSGFSIFSSSSAQFVKRLPLPRLRSNALFFLDSRVCHAPLQDSESAPARLAPEGINVKEAHQTSRTDPTDSFNVFAGAPRTNHRRLQH
jgi:hypothetical protein